MTNNDPVLLVSDQQRDAYLCVPCRHKCRPPVKIVPWDDNLYMNCVKCEKLVVVMSGTERAMRGIRR
jgi:hypothetical protein